MKFGTDFNGSTGFIWVEVRGERIWFSHEFESEVIADIVDDAIMAGMQDRVRSIRERAYNVGKKAARGGPKLDEFVDCINDDEVVC